MNCQTILSTSYGLLLYGFTMALHFSLKASYITDPTDCETTFVDKICFSFVFAHNGILYEVSRHKSMISAMDMKVAIYYTLVSKWNLK